MSEVITEGTFFNGVIADIAEINPRTDIALAEEERVSFLPMQNTSESGDIITLQERVFAQVSKGYTRFAENDVLVAKITPCFENGKGGYAKGLLNGIGFGSTEFHIVRAIPGKADSRFLHHLTRSERFRKAGEGSMTGSAGQKRIPSNFIKDFPIFIPPLPEQKKIAEILSGMYNQILSVKSEIQQARKISTAVTKNLLGSIQDGTLTLSEVAINHDSIRVPIKSEERALRNGPYRYFGASGIIDSIDDFLFDGDYILIGEDGANIIDRNKPLAFKVSGKFWVNNHAHIIQPRESCDINFLTYYLESLDYTGIASGSAQPKITRSALDAIQVPIPPLEVQKKIGAVIESTIDMATTAEKKEKKLIDLRKALSSDLLSGRKRVSI